MNPLFDRDRISVKPLAERKNKLDIQRDQIRPESYPAELDAAEAESVRQAAAEIRAARARGAPVILAFGAHSIKNGLSRVMIRFMQGGWVTIIEHPSVGVPQRAAL